MSQIATSLYIHPEIREKGGAYGSGLSSDLTFYSYRDPNFDRTIQSFEGTRQFLLKENSFGDDDVEQAKLRIFASVDSPVSPTNKGLRYFMHKITHEMRQSNRDRLFAVSADDVKEVAEKYLDTTKYSPSLGVLGNEKELNRLQKDSSWHIHTQPEQQQFQ